MGNSLIFGGMRRGDRQAASGRVNGSNVSDAYQFLESVALPRAAEKFTQGHAVVNVVQTWDVDKVG